MLKMFTLALTLLMPQTAYGDDQLCFDIEVGSSDTIDDEVGEETTDDICVQQIYDVHWQVDDIVCANGIKRTNGYGDRMCLDYGFDGILPYTDLIIESKGYDALWVDRFIVILASSWSTATERHYGSSDHNGWCLSKDRNDHLDWNHDNVPQYVEDNQCYKKIKLKPDGSVEGFTTDEPRKCRVKRTQTCGGWSCPHGWSTVQRTGYLGCGWGRFDYKLVCERDIECRRRIEYEDDEVEVEVLPMNEESGHWVQLSPPTAESSPTDIADLPLERVVALVGDEETDILEDDDEIETLLIDETEGLPGFEDIEILSAADFEEDGDLVQLSPPQAEPMSQSPSLGLADRLSKAEDPSETNGVVAESPEGDE